MAVETFCVLGGVDVGGVDVSSCSRSRCLSVDRYNMYVELLCRVIKLLTIDCKLCSPLPALIANI